MEKSGFAPKTAFFQPFAVLGAKMAKIRLFDHYFTTPIMRSAVHFLPNAQAFKGKNRVS